MASSLRKNTVKLVFGPDSNIPSHLDVLKFSLEMLKLSTADIHSIYKEENGGKFYTKHAKKLKVIISMFVEKTKLKVAGNLSVREASLWEGKKLIFSSWREKRFRGENKNLILCDEI